MLRDARHPERTILLVEANHSLRRMIALGLRYRGLDVIETTSPDDLSDIDMKRRPDLVLLDIDGEVGNGAEALAMIQADALLASLPIVMLAWDTAITASADKHGMQGRSISLAKPFDARALHSVIESQLLQTDQSPAAQEHSAQSAAHTISHVSYAPPASPPAPSFCPMLTAAGLLLAFIGLMLQLAITAIGLLIVIVALLWWTLGTKPVASTFRYL